jgi:hypothetical protein
LYVAYLKNRSITGIHLVFQHLKKEEYENKKQYIEKLGITNYEIVEKKSRQHPMTCYPFGIEY